MKWGDGDVSDVAAAEHALERLFRLSMSRRVHTRQSAAVGTVVTRTGYAVLRTVDEAGDLAMGELARRCAMDPGAAARQVRVLEQEGLLLRSSRSGDARVTVVRLTDAGREVYRRIVAVRRGYLDEVLAGWSAGERAALARTVDRLVDDLLAVPFRPRRAAS